MHARMLEQLNDEQRAAVVAPAGPLVIAAGAGTGKTRTVAARIAYRVAAGDVPAAGVLAVTHTNRAASELRARLDSFRVGDLDLVAVRTFHGAARGQLAAAAAMRKMEAPQVLTDGPALIRDICRASGLDAQLSSAVQREIDWAKCSLVGPEQYAGRAAQRRLPAALTPSQVAGVFARYERALVRRNVLDSTDLLLMAAHQLRTDSELAGVTRNHAQFVVVDEFQDTDPAQHMLLNAWLGDRPDADVTVVGDMRQAIYTWKGSDPGLLARFSGRAGTHVHHLTTNYRSGRAVVKAANALMSGGRLLAQDVTEVRPLVPADSNPEGVVATYVASDEVAEQVWLTAKVEGYLRTEVRPEDIAVLVRTQREVRELVEHLQQRGVPTTCPPESGFFNRAEVVATLREMRRALEEPQSYLASMSGAAALRDVLADTGFSRDRSPDPSSAMWEVWSGRAGLLAWVEQMPGGELLGPWELLELAEGHAREGRWAPVGAVNVLTVHAAKGLEFDVVLCTGWDATSLEQAPEEQRLAYVAATRARKELLVSGARRRQGRDRVPTTAMRLLRSLVAGS